jgi:hypothetical protein
LLTERQVRPITQEITNRLFDIVEDNAILVGGQSLAFWVAHYGIPIAANRTAISIDADFLGGKEVVSAIGKGFTSQVIFPHPDAITAIVGNVRILPDDETYMNVDVIHKVVGIAASKVRERSVEVRFGESTHIRVMHPLHVLRSRMLNFRLLQEKRNENTVMQMRLAIQVAKYYIADLNGNMPVKGNRAALKCIEEVVALAKSGPGRFAKLHGINFEDAIPFAIIASDNFQQKRAPRIVQELARTQPQKNEKAFDFPAAARVR